VKPKTTLVLGASANPLRYSFRAVEALQKHQFEVVAMGLKEGKIGAIPILLPFAKLPPIHTVTLYLNPQRQEAYLDFILQLHPQRVLFNPGTENSEMAKKLSENGIAWENACTLVLLSTNQY